jgi:L-lactate dehydrogenase complex protein LldG
VKAREEILRRIRAATVDVPAGATADIPAAVQIPRDYRQADHSFPSGAERAGLADLVDLFADRVQDYRATVRCCGTEEVPATIAAAVAARNLRRVLAPQGFPPEWLADLPPGISIVSDDPPLTVPDLDRLDGVLTTCAVAIADTGTIVLDHGPGQGRRALSLVPDYHLAVVRVDQIRPGVPEAVAALDPIRPMTWISGPSATSDIELSRVEGVHGPRTLEVIIVVDW